MTLTKIQIVESIHNEIGIAQEQIHRNRRNPYRDHQAHTGIR